MKHSQLLKIIKEEILNALSENAEMDKMNQKLNDKVDVKPVDPSIKNTFKEKEYEVEYWKYVNDDYDTYYITVTAKDEAEALEKAKEELKQSKQRNIRYDKLKIVK